MTMWQRKLVSVGSVAQQIEIGRQILQCERINDKAIAKGLTPPAEAYRIALIKVGAKNRRDLNSVAARTAANATKLIKQQLESTQKRPGTGVEPHLSSLIFSRPLTGIYKNTGSVGVARESTLDKAINPNTPGYGPYWRAQEYGTGSPEVVSQKGRTIVGFFYGPGGEGQGSRPSAQYKGGGGPHPVFIPSTRRTGPKGGAGGKGTIDYEIEGRHFIRDGANLAAAEWKREMLRIDRSAANRIDRATAALTPRRRTPPVRRRRRSR